jgi:DNA polymerase III epsilon subunit-like protein
MMSQRRVATGPRASKPSDDAEFIRKQPFAWRAPGIIIEVGFVEMLREGEGWRKGETWSSKVNPDGPIDPEAIKIHRIRPADLKNAPRFYRSRPSTLLGPFPHRVGDGTV